MRFLLTLSGVATLVVAMYCISAQATQTGEMSAKIHQTCEALASDGIVTDQREAWKRLTAGWSPIIEPKWSVAMTGYVFASAVLFTAAWKWRRSGVRSVPAISKEDRVA